jgi:uncharacterized protein (TIRG00374 family)
LNKASKGQSTGSGCLTTILKIVVSAGLIIYLLRGVRLDEMGQLIGGANLLLLLLALLLYLSAIAVGNLKWSILLRAQGIRVPFTDLLSYTFAGLFFGNVLPTNIGGDLVRAYDLSRHTNYIEQSAISVLIDRLVGLAAFLAAAVLMAVLAALTLANSSGLETIVVATVVVFALFIAAFSLLLSRRVMQRMSFLFKFRLLAPFKPTAQRVFVALQVYRQSYRALAQAFVLSLCGVVLTALTQWVISEALGLGISLFYFMLFNPLIAFVLLVPLSVNGIGLKEAAFVFFLGLVGVPQAAAFALSIVFHFIIVLSSLPGGLVWFRERSTPPIITEPETPQEPS